MACQSSGGLNVADVSGGAAHDGRTGAQFKPAVAATHVPPRDEALGLEAVGLSAGLAVAGAGTGKGAGNQGRT